MPQYWVAIHRPGNYDPSIEDENMGREIDALNNDMVAAGIRVFVGGLKSERTAKSIEQTAADQFKITDGPYQKSTHHVGGFWVLNVATMDEALMWGRRAAQACRAPVEVRPFH